MKRHGEWKLQKNRALSDANMEITIKRAGSDEWTSVDMFCALRSSWRANPLHPRPVYSLQGTSFENGDQMNVRYVHSGRSHAVSFDGTDATNIFPITVRVIG